MSGLAKPENKISIDFKDGINDDIITTLQYRFEDAVKEARPVAKDFKGRDRLDTARNIWMWLKNDITYQKDPDGYQDVRMPRYFHHHRSGDCKSFTLNALAIWANIYPEDKLYFFYAGYTDGTKTPTHVYAKIKPANGGSEIIIDGCWYFVNSEKNYTFGKYSPNMQVRTLSGISEHVQRGPAVDLETMYRRLPAYERGRLDDCMSDLVQLELLKVAKAQKALSARKIAEALDGIAAKHKKGSGKKGAKALHVFNAAALFLGRASFLLFVTLNVNGLASKLQQLIKWGKFGGIDSMWYKLGGNSKKLKKIIAHGATKKKLFLSKKAKAKYEQRYGPLSPNEVAYQKGVHGEISGPEIAAAAVAVIPVLAALIPKMIDAFRSAGPQGHQMAAGLINEGHDLVDNVKNNGFPLDGDILNTFGGGDGGMALDKNGRPIHLTPGKEGGVSYVFDWHHLKPISDYIADDFSISDDVPPVVPSPDDTPAPADPAASIPDYSPTPGTPVDKFSDTMKTLGPLLQTVTTAGLATASGVMAQSNNPNVRKWGNALGGAESALTGHVLRTSGYPNEAAFHEKLHKGTVVNIFPIVAIPVGLFVAYKAYEKLSN